MEEVQQGGHGEADGAQKGQGKGRGRGKGSGKRKEQGVCKRAERGRQERECG